MIFAMAIDFMIVKDSIYQISLKFVEKLGDVPPKAGVNGGTTKFL